MAGGVLQSAIYPLEVSNTLKLIIYERHSDLGTVSRRIDGRRSFAVGNLSVRGNLFVKGFKFFERHSDLGIVSCRIKCWRSLTDGNVLIRGKLFVKGNYN
jgi:hypothetical protein